MKTWLEKQVQPVTRALLNVPPEVITWSALALSLGSAALLYEASDYPWMAVLAIPLLMARLGLGTIEDAGKDTRAGSPARQVINDLSDRLSDLAIFLSFAFWPDIKVHLVLFAIVSMLIVSYVGVLGQAAGAEREHGGLLSKGDRLVLLMVACLLYGPLPNFKIAGFNVFEAMFILFIPLASITLLQRLDRILQRLSGK